MRRISECGTMPMALDYKIEHSINHQDMLVSPCDGVVTIAMVIRGMCRITCGTDVRDIPELVIYIRDRDNEMLEYITNCTGVFEQVAIHFDTKKLFATDCRINQATEHRFQHAILMALASSMSVDDVAKECCMSLSTFKRHFRARYGLSPHCWMQVVRLKLANDMLSRYNIPMGYVLRLCNFRNSSYFIYLFRDTFGVTPSCARQISRYVCD